jgi:hypothetical protein
MPGFSQRVRRALIFTKGKITVKINKMPKDRLPSIA